MKTGNLTLTRCKDQQIYIYDPCDPNKVTIITVTDIRGGKVRLSIEAPMDVVVHRKEVVEAIQAKQRGGDCVDLSQSSPEGIPDATSVQGVAA